MLRKAPVRRQKQCKRRKQSLLPGVRRRRMVSCPIMKERRLFGIERLASAAPSLSLHSVAGLSAAYVRTVREMSGSSFAACKYCRLLVSTPPLRDGGWVVTMSRCLSWDERFFLGIFLRSGSVNGHSCLFNEARQHSDFNWRGTLRDPSRMRWSAL